MLPEKPHAVIVLPKGIRVVFKLGISVDLRASKPNDRWRVDPPDGVWFRGDLWAVVAPIALGAFTRSNPR